MAHHMAFHHRELNCDVFDSQCAEVNIDWLTRKGCMAVSSVIDHVIETIGVFYYGIDLCERRKQKWCDIYKQSCNGCMRVGSCCVM